MPYLLKKKIKGRTYYYLAETQRVEGKPRIVWQKYLGTAERIQERLQAAEISEIQTFELGSVAAIESLEKEIGFIDIVDRIVLKRDQGMSVGEYLYLIVLNRAIEPRSKASLGAWLKGTAISEYRTLDGHALESSNFWDQMEKVEAKDVEAIGDEVARKVVSVYDVSLDCLLYDTTNYFTQMSPETPSELARYAYSKAGKHELRHVGLSLLCSREYGIPLFHRTYPASLHDSKLMFELYGEMTALLRSLKKKDRTTLVFDKGFNSPKNIGRIDAEPGLFFIGALSPYHHPELCLVPLEEYKPIGVPDEEEEPLLAYRTAETIYDRERAVVVTYNPRTYRKKIHWLSRTIRKTKAKLQDLRRGLAEADGRTTLKSIRRRIDDILAESHIATVFDVEVSFKKEYRMSIRTNPQVLKDYRGRFGKNIIFTDHTEWSTDEIVLAYRDRYKIETAFRLTKSPELIRWQPMYHWTDSKIRVHGLTCVMALVYLSILSRKLRRAKVTMAMDRAMEALRGVRRAVYIYPGSSKPIRKLCLLGSTEEELLKALELEI
jgi:transposase